MNRLDREKRTVFFMIQMYCKNLHGMQAELCAGCRRLRDYTLLRVERCVYGEGKPVCSSCRIHCYQPERRDEIRRVMRYSGPRMLLIHPVLAIEHLFDGRRKPAARPRPPG